MVFWVFLFVFLKIFQRSTEKYFSKFVSEILAADLGAAGNHTAQAQHGALRTNTEGALPKDSGAMDTAHALGPDRQGRRVWPGRLCLQEADEGSGGAGPPIPQVPGRRQARADSATGLPSQQLPPG